MTVPIIPPGNFVLPVCISDDNDIVDLLSALDLYRKLRKKSEDYPVADAVYNALQYASNPQDSPCLEASEGTSLGTCYRMDTTTEVFDFFPNDPFNPGDDGVTFTGASWSRLEDILNQDIVPDWIELLISTFGDILGYFPNDCFISYQFPTGLPPVDFTDFLAGLQEALFPFPSVTFKVQGEGEMEIQFCQAPLGGRVLVTWDFLPTLDDIGEIATGNYPNYGNFQLLELNVDTSSFPFELVSTITTEIQLTEDIEHTIRCFFIPVIDDSLPFIFPFSGIREIEFCGNLKVVGSQTDTVYDQNNYKSFGATREGFIMATKDEICEGMLCAMETVAQRILLASDTENVLGDVTIDKDTGEQTIISPVKTFNGGFSVSQKDVYNGQARGIASGFVGMLQDVADWYDDSLSEANIVDRLVAIYGLVNPAGAVAFYIANQTTGLPGYNLDTMTRYIYEGANSATAIARYAYEETSDFAQNLLLQFRSLITPDNYEEWSAQGGQTPLDDWRDYPSNLISSVEFIYDTDKLADASYISTGLLKVTSASRLMRVQFSGSAVADDGYVFDGIYLKSPSGDLTVAQYSISDFQNPFNRGWVTPNNLPGYGDKVGGNYAYNMTRSHGTQNETRITMHSGIHSRNWVSGQVIMTIFDLGAL